MAIITDRHTWQLNSQEARVDKGNLVRVKHADGHYSKMYEQDAIAAGLLAGQAKARPQAENKMRVAEKNKAAAPEPQPDDLTTIPGIGLGVARSLAARGITTYAALKAASDLSYLSKKAQKAVEDWKNG